MAALGSRGHTEVRAQTPPKNFSYFTDARLKKFAIIRQELSFGKGMTAEKLTSQSPVVSLNGPDLFTELPFL